MKNIDEICESVNKSAYGLSMGAIWQHISVECGNHPDDYLYRKDVFFYFIRSLMVSENIKLAANGRYLSGSIEEQIDELQAAWPPYPSHKEDDDLDGNGMWFLVKAPSGVVWLTPEGKEIWT
jgi:hypothetical protein